ncbi:MAG: hypothetical protein OEZ25_07195 [Candidatus Bathyarchaeota archaeon]|nr:hypothetical protein [Candidatus Bathyarchaeota archaeon]
MSEYEKKIRRLRHTLRGAFGLPREPLREKLTEFTKALKAQREAQRNSPPQRETPQQNSQPSPQMSVRERFMNQQMSVKEKLMNRSFFQMFSQQQEPQYTPEEMALIEEQKKQLAEDAEKRKRKEEAEKKAKEDAEALARAYENIAVSSV